ncbi:MAG TPA: AAA family ATPase [Bryobacteraceae bacterium]|jgi:ATP-dependent Clp protease ATP-binding subunit ClpB|nr:AAA family ATPase [Bryobacteraceae bacterium]
MPLDLDKLSNDLEDALERARLLAERRRQAQITPVHMLYVLLDNGSSLAAVLDKSGVSCGALLDSFAARLNKEPNAPLEAGRRPTASRSLRNLIERSFQKMTERGSEVAEPIDFLLAAVESSEEDLRGQLRESGLTPDAAKKAVEQRAAASEALGEKPRISKDGAPTGTKVLERFGRDLTALAKSGELMPVVGREDEIRRVIQTLLRKTKNNPVLVGDPGTGKTAIAEGLALRIIEGDVPESLKKCRVVALDLTAMVAGAKYRGEFEERIKTVVDEVRARKGEIVLFLDELHSLVGAGGTEGGMDAANILKPALARGELRCVGATTFDEYREKIEKDGALSRRFELVAIKEPTDETMMVILRGIRPRYEAYHGVRLTEEALQASVKLTRRYMRSRFLPDKAIDVLDEAAARIRMQKESRPTHIDQKERLLIRKEAELEALRASANTAAQKRTVADLEAEVARLKPEVEALVSEWKSQREASDLLQKTKQAIEEQSAALQDAERRGDVAKAAEIRYGSLKYLEQQREDLERRAGEQKQTAILSDLVRPEDIAEVISERVGVPVQRMLESERERLLKLEERIGSRVFGQDAAVSAVSEAARRMRADLQPGRKPTSFLFVGPTGVGKTELAKALAEALFDDETALIRIDMGEYKDKSSTSGLIGSRPGLVGSDEGGFLTEQVRRSPYSVVLFDEIEKAHPEVLDLLLGVLDEGRLTDAKGRFCDFSNTLILFTSNLGVREAMAMTEDPEKRREIILTVVKETLRPELYNRISQVIAFNSLTDTDLERIVRVQLDALGKKLLEDRDITLEATPEAVTYLGKMSWDPAYGARPVGRTMQQLVLSPAATAVLSGEVSAGDTLQIVCPDPEQGLDFQVLQGAAAAQ